MGKMLRFNNAHYIHFVTTRTRKSVPYFKDEKNCLALLKNIESYRSKHKFSLRAYCVMPDHLHILIEPCFNEADGIKPPANQVGNETRLGDGFTPSLLIQDIIHDIKGKTAIDIRKRLKIQNRIWQKSFYDFPIYSDRKLEEKFDYIHNNPIRAGLVTNLDEYTWSSYQNYYLNNHSLIKIN